MSLEPSRVATSLSRFAVLLAIAACSPRSPHSGVDAPSVTSLAGAVACGTGACTTGQLCYAQDPGIDAGVGGGRSYECYDVPTGCTVFDCSGSACPTCVIDQCGVWPALVDLMSVMGRTVNCPGQ
jgi:hypothetical protein